MIKSFKTSYKNELEEFKKEYSKSREYSFYLEHMAFKFKVGDILIKRPLNEEGVPEEFEKYQDSCMPTRFLVVEIDEKNGNSIIMRINEDGELDKEEISETIASIRGWDFDLYELDPFYADSVILNEEFNLKEFFNAEKERKSRILESRKESGIVLKDLKSVNDFFRNNKEVYLTEDINPGHDVYTFKKIKLSKSINSYKKARSNESLLERIVEQNKKALNEDKVLRVELHGSILMWSPNFIGWTFFTSKPRSYDETL